MKIKLFYIVCGDNNSNSVLKTTESIKALKKPENIFIEILYYSGMETDEIINHISYDDNENTKKYFVIVKSECAWSQDAIVNLNSAFNSHKHFNIYAFAGSKILEEVECEFNVATIYNSQNLVLDEISAFFINVKYLEYLKPLLSSDTSQELTLELYKIICQEETCLILDDSFYIGTPIKRNTKAEWYSFGIQSWVREIRDYSPAIKHQQLQYADYVIMNEIGYCLRDRVDLILSQEELKTFCVFITEYISGIPDYIINETKRLNVAIRMHLYKMKYGNDVIKEFKWYKDKLIYHNMVIAKLSNQEMFRITGITKNLKMCTAVYTSFEDNRYSYYVKADDEKLTKLTFVKKGKRSRICLGTVIMQENFYEHKVGLKAILKKRKFKYYLCIDDTYLVEMHDEVDLHKLVLDQIKRRIKKQ